MGCHFFLHGSSWSNNWTHVPCVSCIAGKFFTHWAIKGGLYICMYNWITLLYTCVVCLVLLFVYCASGLRETEECVLSCSVVSNSWDPIDCSLPGSMGFSRQEYWNELPLPSPEDLPNPGIKPRSLALPVDSLPSEPPRKPVCHAETSNWEESVPLLGARDCLFLLTLVTEYQWLKGSILIALCVHTCPRDAVMLICCLWPGFPIHVKGKDWVKSMPNSNKTEFSFLVVFGEGESPNCLHNYTLYLCFSLRKFSISFCSTSSYREKANRDRPVSFPPNFWLFQSVFLIPLIPALSEGMWHTYILNIICFLKTY